MQAALEPESYQLETVSKRTKIKYSVNNLLYTHTANIWKKNNAISP